MTNTRLKDYFDLWVLFERESFDINTLSQAISATFIRRDMDIPDEISIGLTEEFSSDPTRQKLWTSFLRKNNLKIIPLADVVARARDILEPVKLHF